MYSTCTYIQLSSMHISITKIPGIIHFYKSLVIFIMKIRTTVMAGTKVIFKEISVGFMDVLNYAYNCALFSVYIHAYVSDYVCKFFVYSLHMKKQKH